MLRRLRVSLKLDSANGQRGFGSGASLQRMAGVVIVSEAKDLAARTFQILRFAQDDNSYGI